jgi:hypothetical protein
MKQFYSLILALLISGGLYATTIVAVNNNGRWSRSSDWDLNRTPINTDSVVIPAGLNFNVDGNQRLNNVVVIVKGTLDFNNGKLRLNIASKVIVDLGGRITGSGNNDQITIDNVFKYRGSGPDVIGPMVADASTGNGFISFTLLPVKFVSFTANKNSEGVFLSWSTTNEVNNSYFEIQRSKDGKNWDLAGKVNAATTTQNVNNYRFVDRSSDALIAYYRIRQVDLDGKSTYTEIRSIRSNSTEASAKIFKSGNQLVVELSNSSVEHLNIRIVNLNGVIVANHSITKASSRVSVPVDLNIKGLYVVQVIQKGTGHVSKVML